MKVIQAKDKKMQANQCNILSKGGLDLDRAERNMRYQQSRHLRERMIAVFRFFRARPLHGGARDDFEMRAGASGSLDSTV